MVVVRARAIKSFGSVVRKFELYSGGFFSVGSCDFADRLFAHDQSIVEID
ncbi:MAG TPA: hypothetical protein VF251_01965 [Pyrinomonadaceae bacterium]